MRKIENNTKILAYPEMTIRDALKNLDIAAEGILFVIDKDKRLL